MEIVLQPSCATCMATSAAHAMTCAPPLSGLTVRSGARSHSLNAWIQPTPTEHHQSLPSRSSAEMYAFMNTCSSHAQQPTNPFSKCQFCQTLRLRHCNRDSALQHGRIAFSRDGGCGCSCKGCSRAMCGRGGRWSAACTSCAASWTAPTPAWPPSTPFSGIAIVLCSKTSSSRACR